MYICGRGILFFMGFVYINYIDKRGMHFECTILMTFLNQLFGFFKGSEKKGEVDVPILVVSNHVRFCCLTTAKYYKFLVNLLSTAQLP